MNLSGTWAPLMSCKAVSNEGQIVINAKEIIISNCHHLMIESEIVSDGVCDNY